MHNRLGLSLLAPIFALACDASGSGSAANNNNIASAILGAGQAVACPELVGVGSAIGVKYTAEARLNAKIGAFVQAAKDLKSAAMSIEGEVYNACSKMGADLGISPDRMAEQAGPAGKVKGACAALEAEVKTILAGGITIDASYDPPKCQINASAKASCEGSCEVEVEPATIVAECSPAQLSGTCEGTCGGSCEGTCNGECSGECSAKDAQGKCVGSCSGECRGTCSGTCHASCQGTWKAPKCEGKVTPPSVDADCKASCNASAEIKGSCTKPRLELKASSSTEMIGKLLASASVHLPALLVAQFKFGKQAAQSVKILVKLGNELSGEIEGAGSRAAACVSAAASAVAEASLSINVSVQASASVSGQVGAGI
jgi:hypothetical protein